MRSLLSLLLVIGSASTAQAQIHGASSGRIPPSVARLVAELEKDSTTIKASGDYRVPVGTRLDGNIVVRNAHVTVAGEVTGAVVVLFGDLTLEPGAVIAGDIAIVDGGVFGADDATLNGEFNQYFGGFGSAPQRSYSRLRHDMPFSAHSEIEFGIEGNYNRVEGLPIRVGPEVRSGGANPLRAYAYAILRTEPGIFDTEDMGYRAAAEQRIPGSGGLWLGATAYSVNEPIDRWWFTDQEASLAAALYHEDVRDYYDRSGWMVYARFAPKIAPVDITVGYANERHESAPLRDPWTLFRGGESWRPMPLSAEGELNLVHATGTLDLRHGSGFGTTGFMLRTQMTHALEGTVTRAGAATVGFAGFVTPRSYEAPFTAGLIDARLYQPIVSSVLAARAVFAGSVDGSPLPPAYQSALGGAGSLPGYSAFSVNCGARQRVGVPIEGSETGQRIAFAGYGCDRIALFQAEYRSDFNSRVRARKHDHDDDHDWWWDFDIDPDFILFFDAGRGWSYDNGSGSTTTKTLADAGAGIVLGGVGLFGAVPLSGDDRGLRIFLRLGPRF